jgi:hypothetical protein
MTEQLHPLKQLNWELTQLRSVSHTSDTVPQRPDRLNAHALILFSRIPHHGAVGPRNAALPVRLPCIADAKNVVEYAPQREDVGRDACGVLAANSFWSSIEIASDNAAASDGSSRNPELACKTEIGHLPLGLYQQDVLRLEVSMDDGNTVQRLQSREHIDDRQDVGLLGLLIPLNSPPKRSFCERHVKEQRIDIQLSIKDSDDIWMSEPLQQVRFIYEPAAMPQGLSFVVLGVCSGREDLPSDSRTFPRIDEHDHSERTTTDHTLAIDCHDYLSCGSAECN